MYLVDTLSLPQLCRGTAAASRLRRLRSDAPVARSAFGRSSTRLEAGARWRFSTATARLCTTWPGPHPLGARSTSSHRPPRTRRFESGAFGRARLRPRCSRCMCLKTTSRRCGASSGTLSALCSFPAAMTAPCGCGDQISGCALALERPRPHNLTRAHAQGGWSCSSVMGAPESDEAATVAAAAVSAAAAAAAAATTATATATAAGPQSSSPLSNALTLSGSSAPPHAVTGMAAASFAAAASAGSAMEPLSAASLLPALAGSLFQRAAPPATSGTDDATALLLAALLKPAVAVAAPK